MAKKEKIKEVFLPKWVAWFNLFLIVLVMFLILYINSIVSENEKIPAFGLILLFSIFIIIIIVVFLSAYKRLPIYYLREK